MAVADLAKKSDPVTCAACDLLATLDPKRAKILRDLLTNPGVRYSELSVELAADPDWGFDVSRASLARHARGQCAARERLRK